VASLTRSHNRIDTILAGFPGPVTLDANRGRD
jgi:hypothetical protein